MRPIPAVMLVLAMQVAGSPAMAQRLPFEKTLDAAGVSTLDVSTIRGTINIVSGEAGRISPARLRCSASEARRPFPLALVPWSSKARRDRSPSPRAAAPSPRERLATTCTFGLEAEWSTQALRAPVMSISRPDPARFNCAACVVR